MIGDMLDTNVVIRYLAGDEATKHLVENIIRPSISVIVMGELQYGAQKSSRAKSNLVLLTNFFFSVSIVPIDEKIAAKYGEVKNQLHSHGINIPENDIWIAATAISRQCSLLTYDAHFKSVAGLDAIP